MKFKIGDKVKHDFTGNIGEIVNAYEITASGVRYDVRFPNGKIYERYQDGEVTLVESSKAERDYFTVTVADTFNKIAQETIDIAREICNDTKQVKIPTAGVKHDQGKPDLSMIPYEALEEIAKVLMFGATKYDKNNWKKGINSTRLAGAALRHLGKWCDGVDIDSESSENHLAHAATNLLMLIWMLKHKPELDDRA